jgi:hypothetical protein
MIEIKVINAIYKIAFSLTIATILIGCDARFPPEKEKAGCNGCVSSNNFNSLKSAIEELRVMKIKIESKEGINPKEYGEDLEDLVNIVNKAYGNPKHYRQ